MCDCHGAAHEAQARCNRNEQIINGLWWLEQFMLCSGAVWCRVNAEHARVRVGLRACTILCAGIWNCGGMLRGGGE